MKILYLSVLIIFIFILKIEMYADNLEEVRKLREAGRFDEAIEILQKSTWIKILMKMRCGFTLEFVMY